MRKFLIVLAIPILSLMLYACGGSSGGGDNNVTDQGTHSTVANTEIIEPGETCANGGILVQTGIDLNGNGLLDESEVNAEQAVCNGNDGNDGAESLIEIVTEEPGDNCEYGGQKITAGIDSDGNGVLDESEITETEYICNTTNFADHAQGCSQGPFHCHSDLVESTKYLESVHVTHSDHITQDSPKECLACHDPFDEGYQFENFVEEGVAVVSCSACHIDLQSGLLKKEPDASGCSPEDEDGNKLCHTKFEGPSAGHFTYHPFADNITGLYEDSAHGMMEGHETGRCSVCHSDEGFREYADDYRGMGREDFRAQWDADSPVEVGESRVQCRTCHEPHSTELRTDDVTQTETLSDNSTVEATLYSAEFQLCTTCHQVFLDATYDEDANKYDYALSSDYENQRENTFYHYNKDYRDIADTHFAGNYAMLDDNDTVTSVETLDGYQIDAASPYACRQCHDVHAASKFDHMVGWHRGGHSEYKAESFNHWEGGDSDDAECFACHSGIEFVKEVVGGHAGYNNTSGNVVGCVACHDLQARNADYDPEVDGSEPFELGPRREFVDNHTFPSDITMTPEQLGEDQLCLSCHSGRNAGNDVDTYIAENPGTFNFARINPHYFVAGSTLYGTLAQIGYQYEGKMYASKFEHVATNDSCVECHSPHSTDLAITKNYAGDIDGDGVDAKTCNECHTAMTENEDARDIRMTGSNLDYDGDSNVTEGMYAEVEGLKTLLYDELIAQGVVDVGHYPYWSNITTEAQFKAAFNYKVVSNDPGMYAHNSAYAIQLLYDSIEDLGGDVSGLIRDDEAHFDASSEAFRHWDEDGEMSTSCARCHSSEGAELYYADKEAHYDLEDGTLISDESFNRKDTMGISSHLACQVCHELDEDSVITPDNAEVVEASAYTTFYKDQHTGAQVTLADKGLSNLCINCHGGRDRSAYDQVLNNTLDGSLRGPHYFVAAGTMFNNVAYEFDGKDYGTNYHLGLGGSDNGPCISCHMTGTEATDKHAFGIDFATNDTCSSCHSALYPQNQAQFDEVKAGYENAYKALEDMVIAKFDPEISHRVPAPEGGWGSTENMGAVYNMLYLHGEPGAFTHSPTYTKRIIFDSLDWLDNGALDGNIDLTGYAQAAAWMGAGDASSVSRP
ncbi:DUF7151 family protein [Limisalsivibrio acetivorans]|uniref:DUF7151 family protein n=1 Tax=Limisalsivibrio acetivorans TaxID=1304888 RepID=UPI0003B7520B|nr:hypothetical protein [Limisalsivibrio acetivorans]